MYRYFSVRFYASLKSIGAGVPSMAYTQNACGWIRPTSLTVELSLFGLRTTIPLRESRITAYLQPLQVLCLTIKQTRQDGAPQMATPSPREFFSPPHGQGGWPSHLDMCLCSMVASTNPFLLHRPSRCGNPLSSCCTGSPFAHATLRQCHFFFFLCVCAGFPAIEKSTPITLPRRLNVSTQHGSRSARTAETQSTSWGTSPG